MLNGIFRVGYSSSFSEFCAGNVCFFHSCTSASVIQYAAQAVQTDQTLYFEVLFQRNESLQFPVFLFEYLSTVWIDVFLFTRPVYNLKKHISNGLEQKNFDVRYIMYCTSVQRYFTIFSPSRTYSPIWGSTYIWEKIFGFWMHKA